MSDQAAGKEEIVEEDGIVNDYQNANGEVIKRDQIDSTNHKLPQHEIEHEDIDFEDFAEEDGNEVVKVEKNDQDIADAKDRTNSKRKYCQRIQKEKPTPRKAKSSFRLTKKKYDAYGVPYLDTKTIFIPEQFRIQASDVSLATRSIILNIGKLIF